MLMGPVFRAELLRTSRQRRYYALRLVYGLVLLALVWTGYEQLRDHRPVISTADLASFAMSTFVAFAVLQLVTVLLLVPPLFGGAIADEKQRKTLHYIMASQLSSGEIILDKVFGRAGLVAVLVAIGLPVVSILALSGGISAEAIVVAYVGTFTTVAFAVALTMLVSTFARRVRDAIITSYLLVIGWQLVPPLILIAGISIRPALYFWIEPVNEWLVDSSPLGAVLMAEGGVRRGAVRSSIEDQFLLMAGLQLAGTALFLLLAIWRLRPTFRRQEEIPARRGWFRSKTVRPRRRLFDPPPCGDDPVGWKERHYAPVDRFTRVVLLPAIIIITLPLALMTEADGRLSQIIVDYWRTGLEARRHIPPQFLRMLQVDLGWYTAFWLLAVAGASASSVTIEREKDTWVSLTATPLTGWEILRGKVLGAIWNQRGFAAVLIFLWALGLLTLGVHPLGVLTSIAAVGLLTWFVAAVGLYTSLRTFSTSRALTTAILALAICNGYPLVLVLWFRGELDWHSSFSALGVMPSLAAWWLAIPHSNGSASQTIQGPHPYLELWPSSATIPVVMLLTYAGAAIGLTSWIARRFDRWLDRPPLVDWQGRSIVVLASPTDADLISVGDARPTQEGSAS
jgi:ABC-type transport system involved in multi-copper enzyme maturation permease subunit